jgi:heat shock protein HtpX
MATAVLLLSLCGILGLMGFMVFGAGGALAAVVGGLIALGLFPLASNDVVIRMLRGQRLSYAQAPWLHEMVNHLAQKAGLPKTPQLYLIPRGEPNAMAIGSRKKPAIGVFHGLLNQLNREELEGVIAHELMHIRNNDTYLMNVSSMMHRLTQNIAFLGVVLVILSLPMYVFGLANPPLFAMALLFVLPTASQLLLFAMSRTREFNADMGAVALTNNPHGLASALRKLEYQRNHFIQRFFPGRTAQPPNWLNTHPPTRERITRIYEAAQSQPPQGSNTAWPETKTVKLYHPKRFNPRMLS